MELPVHAHGRAGQRGGQNQRDITPGGHIHQTNGRSWRVTALDNVSFEVRKGERVGLIGSNGAGKSTLLRVLAGIYRPSVGDCQVNGRISTLFTNQLGLNQNATGYENIMLCGVLLGLTRDMITTLTPEIAEFSELGEFLNFPVRTYSAGMRLRLGFAIATSINPDILLIDEVFGAGDRNFRNKAQERIAGVMDTANALVMATHSTSTLEGFCNKLLWMEHGQIKAFGETREVLKRYASVNGKQDD